MPPEASRGRRQTFIRYFEITCRIYWPMRLAAAAAALTTTFLAAYLPDIGHGFIRDDFQWIATSRAATPGEVLALFTTTEVGFYRPLVSLSFAVDHALWALDPAGYALTNLLLLASDVALLYLLARRFVPPPAAALAAAVWAFNFHGINMALLWLSGRTALLLVLFALGAAHALLRGARVTSALLVFAALLCKEEAVLLPALFTVFLALDGRLRGAPAAASSLFAAAWPLWAPLAPYALLRLQSGAFLPSEAPWFYRFTPDPALLLRNAIEYADRALTLAAAVSLALAAAARRLRSGFLDAERRALLLAAVWIPASYVLTISLPLRSSLYALLPSIGGALAAGACAARAARDAPIAFQRVAVCLVGAAMLAVPVYRARNQRWVEPADLSARIVREVRAAADRHPGGGLIVFADAPGTSTNFDSVFSSLADAAVRLTLGPAWRGALATPPDPPPADAALIVELRDGAVAARAAR
jgi:hypothetical protein